MWAEQIGQLLIPTLAGLGGVWLGGWITGRNERERRKSEFVSRQLNEFYGPLLSLRQEIKVRSEIRHRVQNTADQVWRQKFDWLSNPAISQKFSEESRPKFAAIIDDDNNTMREILMPMYRDMVTTFRDRMWLADPQTREYFGDLIEFVDIWDRYLRDAIPGEVIQALGHSEEKVKPFYAHVEGMCDDLRSKLAGDRGPQRRHA